jgi:hypothetical protein
VPGLANVVNILEQGGSGLTASTANAMAITPVLGLHAMILALGQYKSHLAASSPLTAADVNNAMLAATNLDMWGIVPAWTPAKFLTIGGSFGAVFAHVSNPYIYDQTWNNHYNVLSTFDITKDLPGATG